MIALVVKVKAKPGQRDALRVSALKMANAVRTNEKGNKLFIVGDGPDEDSLVMLERYVDEAAMAEHRGMAHFKEIGREMGQFMDGRPEVVFRFVEHE